MRGQGLQADFTVEVSDLVYHPQGLQALLYRPQAEGLLPAAVLVHGGAWVAGDRFATERIARHLAARGIVLLAIDLRMGRAHPYPAAVQDVNLAVRWLRQHAAELAIDAARIGGVGVSSGGHLALLAAMRPADARYAALPLAGGEGLDAGMAFVLSCSGVLDPLARYEMAQAAGATDIVACHHRFFGTSEVMDEASPPRMLLRGERVSLPILRMYQGEDDPRLPPQTARRMAELYTQAGGDAVAHYFPGVGHATSEWPQAALDAVAEGLASVVR